MTLYHRIFLIFFFIFFSCTPVSQNKDISIKEKIKSKIAIEPKQKRIPVKEKPIAKSSKNVRVGLMENEKKIIFSFKGSYSIYSGEKIIFTTSVT